MGWQAVAHLQWHGFIGMSWHDGVIIAAPPIPTPRMPNVTFNVLNGAFLGSLPSAGPEPLSGWGGVPLLGRTNDAGFVSPHVSIPPNNSLLPLTILLGGSESMLGSSSVRTTCTNLIWGTDEYDVATCTIPYVPISTNFGCNDPLFVPLDMVISPNTILVGVGLADLLAMAIDLILMALLEAVTHFGGKKAKKWWKNRKMGKATKAGQSAYEKALKEGASEAREEATERAARKQDLAAAMRKRRAMVTGTPAPPPKPKKALIAAQKKAADEAVEKQARKAGDEAYNKELRKRFFKTGGPWKQSFKKVDDSYAVGALKIGGNKMFYKGYVKTGEGAEKWNAWVGDDGIKSKLQIAERGEMRENRFLHREAAEALGLDYGNPNDPQIMDLAKLTNEDIATLSEDPVFNAGMEILKGGGG